MTPPDDAAPSVGFGVVSYAFGGTTCADEGKYEHNKAKNADERRPSGTFAIFGPDPTGANYGEDPTDKGKECAAHVEHGSRRLVCACRRRPESGCRR